MNSGTCEGGPYHGRRLHDLGTVFPVAIDQRTLRAIPGRQKSNTTDPDTIFCEYRFADGVWTWHA